MRSRCGFGRGFRMRRNQFARALPWLRKTVALMATLVFLAAGFAVEATATPTAEPLRTSVLLLQRLNAGLEPFVVAGLERAPALMRAPHGRALLLGAPEGARTYRYDLSPARTVALRFVATNTVDEGASRLVGANRAEIDPRKLTEYALSPSHPIGRNKARVFESAFGFNQSNADDLIAQLQKGVMENTPVPSVVDKFGTRFTVDIPVSGPTGSGIVRTGWIYTPGSLTPRLTTAFPK